MAGVQPDPSLSRSDSQADDGHLQGLAMLAFGSLSRYDESTQTQHLALLHAESLELDLDDPAQRRFGDYELLEQIGEGGMGVVYRARQMSLDRAVAVKLLSAGPWASREFIARFEREAQNAARMQHPNIVTVFETGSHDGLHFMSMRLVEGQSLSALLKRGERFSPLQAATLMRAVAEALFYAHRLGVLHLDLKPGNVLVGADGVPYVADFGLARRLDSAATLENDEVSGTPSYMAPEQARVRSQRLTAATDVWGLGAILYELLTGQPPFRADSAQATLKLVLEGTVRSPRRLRPALPADLQAIVLRCLARDPDGRYPSARALADDLARYVEGRPVQARPLNAVQRTTRWAKREPKLATAAVCAVGALLIGLAVSTAQWRRADSNAEVAQHNAATASQRLWDSRDAASLAFMESGDGWKAGPLLLANLAEMEAQGSGERAAGVRKRLGILVNQNPRLIDVLPTPEGTSVLAFSPDASKLAATPDVNDLRLFDLASGREDWKLGVAGNPYDAAWLSPEHMEFDLSGRSILISHQRPPRAAPFPMGIFMYRADVTSGRWLANPPVADPANVELGYSADGEHAITFHPRTGVQVWRSNPWRVASSAPKFPKVGLAGPVLFAPDMRSFAFRAPDTEGVWLFATDTLRRKWELDPPGFGHQMAWAFSPDSRWIAIGDSDGTVDVADTATHETRRLLPSPLTGIRELVFSKDGAWLAAAAGNGGVYLWTWPEGRLLAWPFAREIVPDRVRLDRAHGRVLASGMNGAAGLWEIPDTRFAADRGEAVPLGDRIATIAGRGPDQSGGGDAVAWLPDKGLLAHVTTRRVQVQRLPPAVLKGAHAAPIKPAALRFDGRRLVAVEGNQVRLIDASTETPLGAQFEFPQPPGFAELTADGRTLVVTAGRVLHAYDAVSREPRFAPVMLDNSPQHVELNPDGTSVVTTWFDHDARGVSEVAEIRDLRSGHRTGDPVRLPGVQDGLVFNPDGSRLLAWNFAHLSQRDGHTLAAIPGPLADLRIAPHEMLKEGYARTVAFGPDDAVWLSLTRGEDPVIAELHRYARDGTLRVTRKGHPLLHIMPLADGSMLSIPENTRTLMLHSRDGTRELPDIKPETQRAVAALSADCRWLARAQRDGVVLFDVRQQTRIAVLHAALPAPDIVWQLVFSPDGNRLLARSMRNRMMVWNLQPDARPVPEIARELALRDITPGLGGGQAGSDPGDAERAGLRAHDPGMQSPVPPIAQRAVRMLPGGAIVPRDPRAPPELLDLAGHYNFGFDEVSRAGLLVAGDYGWLSTGVQRVLGVDYDLRGGIQMQAGTGAADSRRDDKPHAFSVPAPRPDVAAVDVLMLANPASTSVTRDLFELTLHYADGGQARQGTSRFAQPWDSLQMSELPKTLPVAAAGYDARAYTMRNRPVRVYALRFPNPHPERALRAITVTAGDGSGVSAVILAVTVEPRAPASHLE